MATPLPVRRVFVLGLPGHPSLVYARCPAAMLPDLWSDLWPFPLPTSARQLSTVSPARSPWQVARESLLTQDCAHAFPLPIFQRNVERLVCHRLFHDVSMVLLDVFRVLLPPVPAPAIKLLPMKPWRRGSPGTSCQDVLQTAISRRLETSWIGKKERQR